MATAKKPMTKTTLHARNRNREAYDLAALKKVVPDLVQYITINKHGNESVDFANPIAVKLLNKALLHHYYGIENWDFPDQNLCPPIPGRADYIHHIADLLAGDNRKNIRCLDIGVGASCIYPILGVVEYGWDFVGVDIDSSSILSSQKIVASNNILDRKISCRLQENPQYIFKGIVTKDERFDVSICNPPFHTSDAEAQKGTNRKVQNLSGENHQKATLNFAGVSNELIYRGGEAKFIKNMIEQSQEFAENIGWFTTLVSKKDNLKAIYKSLRKIKPKRIKTIDMATGNKTSRIVAWTFQD